MVLRCDGHQRIRLEHSEDSQALHVETLGLEAPLLMPVSLLFCRRRMLNGPFSEVLHLAAESPLEGVRAIGYLA